MEVGLLWYDGDPKRPLEEKVGQAAERYRQKYGRWPNTCYVHPEVVGKQDGGGLKLAYRPKSAKAAIRVLPAPNVLMHHFWLGEARDEKGNSGRRKAARITEP
jgi:hypothetical protein